VLPLVTPLRGHTKPESTFWDAGREIHEARLEGRKRSPVSSVGLKLGAEERVQWTGTAFTDCVLTPSEKLLVKFAVEVESDLGLDLHIGIYVNAGACSHAHIVDVGRGPAEVEIVGKGASSTGSLCAKHRGSAETKAKYHDRHFHGHELSFSSWLEFFS
jgi:hypothetical protein